MSDKKRKRGRPRVTPVLSYGSEMKMRNNIARTIKKPRYLQEQDDEHDVSRNRPTNTPAQSFENLSVYSRNTINGRSDNGRGYNPEIDDKDSEYHYGSDFDDDNESDREYFTPGIDSRSISEATSDFEDCSEMEMEGERLSDGNNVNLCTNPESSQAFVPFWKLGPAGNLGFRPHTPIPVWLQDREYPLLQLPQSSDDLLIPRPLILQAVGIYEVLRHFRNIARLSPFHFEDFCACLLVEEHNLLLSEIHIALLKALIREEDAQQTHFGQLDQKDSLNIALYFVDAMTWAETLRNYLESDVEFKATLEIIASCNYPFTTLLNRLKVLQFLCDQFLQTSSVREDLLNEGKIRYDDHCRACHKTGDLLCCDSCSAVYHIDCAEPPLSNTPLEIEDWTCSVCNKHKVEGVTNCLSLMESSGLMCRQEPLGYDRHGRKYWFLVRRIIVEAEDGEVWYYSTLEQLDLLMVLMDSVDLEEALFVALKEFGDDIRRQIEITEKITDHSRGSRRAAIAQETEETRRRIEELQEKKRQIKMEEGIKLEKIIEEVKVENESGKEIQAMKSEDKGTEVPEGNARQSANDEVKSEANVKTPEQFTTTPIKNEKLTGVYDEENLQAMVETKIAQLTRSAGNLFRLGCENAFRTYCNQYASNTLALNKLQHNEERDKKRHLAHKFSLTNNSEFKWAGLCYGGQEIVLHTVRQTILSLEQNISAHFMHPNWQYTRKAWIHSVGTASTPQDFAKAMLRLVSCIKTAVFNSVWSDSLGHTRLKRMTALDREERKKQEKREKKDADDESRLLPFVKFTKPIKHSLWKVKGEEYRTHGLWGWQWVACNRKARHIAMSTVGLRAGPDKITIPIKSTGGLVRGLPINKTSYNALVAKNPSLKTSLFSPKQMREMDGGDRQEKGLEKKKDVTLPNAGQFEVSAISLEEYFEDGVINVSNELSSKLRLVYPRICKESSLDSFLARRLALKVQEEREMSISKDTKKETDNEAPIDVENDSDSTLSENLEENIEEIPDSQRQLTIQKLKPAGHLLKEMRTHKFKYEALDKFDETLPCYSPSCRKGGRSCCYSSSCILKERTKQKLINSINNYKIITSKPAPFDNVGSCSPVHLSDSEKQTSVKPKSGREAFNTYADSMEPKNQNQTEGSRNDLKIGMDEDSSSSQQGSDQKLSSKGERVFSAECTSGKVYLKRTAFEIKKLKKHKFPPLHYFHLLRSPVKEESNDCDELKPVYSLFYLPAWELCTLARKGGHYSPSGFNANAKNNQHIWPYPCPRPVFRVTYLYRVSLMRNLNEIAYLLRILWACLRWDDMHEKGPPDGHKQVTTDAEIIQTEILKRKICGRFHERTQYLRRKVTIPLDMPKPVREFTPSQRSGLRKRRRAQSPVNKQPESIEEWVEEEKLDLWEIRYIGERLEKAASLTKKADRDGPTGVTSRSTSPAELRAKMEEQLKIQRASFNQRKSLEMQSFNAKKGIVKVAIGSAIPSTAAKITFSSSRPTLIQGTPSIVTMGKTPTVLTGRKIVTTKGGKIITVQTAGGLTTTSQSPDGPPKTSVGKSSVFPVSSLPKVQVNNQGNKIIKLQSISSGQRAILPRMAPSIIRTATPVSQQSTTPSTLRPANPNHHIQILQLSDGQFQVKGLQDGQQLLQRTDGKLHFVNTKVSSPIQVTHQTKVVPSKEGVSKGATTIVGGQIIKDASVPSTLAAGQILKINGQQVLLRTGGSNKSILGVNAKDVLAGQGALLNAHKFKMVKSPTSDGFNLKPAPAPATILKEKQPLVDERLNSDSLPVPESPVKEAAPSSPSVANTITLRVQVRMTEQGAKTIIQGLQPGVGLTKDHIMAIQQQVRSMLTQYNLQVNQLSPLMTLTLHSAKAQSQPNQTQTENQSQGLKSSIDQPVTGLNSPIKIPSADLKPLQNLSEKTDDKSKSTDLFGEKDLASETKENAQDKFVLTSDYIQQSIKAALNKDDLNPEVEEKLMQLQKSTTNKTENSVSRSEDTSISFSKKRSQDQHENAADFETNLSLPKSKRAKAEAVKAAKIKKDSCGAIPLGGNGSKSQLQDARKKLLRHQKMQAVLAKHKDLLKKDILKKRALLEKELQLQIHKELSVAKQRMQTVEKLKNPEPVVTPAVCTKKDKQENVSSTTPLSREASKAVKKGEISIPAQDVMAQPAKHAKISSAKNKKSSKTKSKKIVCICRTAFDDSKFYVGCDLCGNWFHGDCVGITEALSRSMTEYVCDDCANAKLNKDLFCFCKQPYDETQFYICCEKCDDWYHGKCIGIMQAEADDIDDYICPKCDPDNVWNRPCQKKLNSKDYVELKKLAKLLIQHKNAWPFLEPVDQSEVPDYYKVVKVSMDLKTVEKNVSLHKYVNLYQFVCDVMLIFDNCRAYNPPNSSFCSCAQTLEVFFCSKLKQLKLKVGQSS